MPYLAHFGLKGHPFALTPDIEHYFPTQDNANIIASLDFALRRDSGIIKIVGEVGTGKTLLCRLLMHKLIENDKVAYINAPQADSSTILRMVCEEFGVPLSNTDASPYSGLNRFLVETHAEDKLAVVVVDEAQHLGRDGLEAVRLMSNLETEKNKLLQIVLFAQTELDDLLKDPSLRQLTQRIVFSFETKPMTIAEAKRYIAHRVRVSRHGGVDYEIFSDAALELIARSSGGTPRVINILADKALLVAFSDNSPIVQKSHARDAIKDSPGLAPRTFGADGVEWLRTRLGQIFKKPMIGKFQPATAAIASMITVILVMMVLVVSRSAPPPAPLAPPVAAESAVKPVETPASIEAPPPMNAAHNTPKAAPAAIAPAKPPAKPVVKAPVAVKVVKPAQAPAPNPASAPSPTPDIAPPNNDGGPTK